MFFSFMQRKHELLYYLHANTKAKVHCLGAFTLPCEQARLMLTVRVFKEIVKASNNIHNYYYFSLWSYCICTIPCTKNKNISCIKFLTSKNYFSWRNTDIVACSKGCCTTCKVMNFDISQCLMSTENIPSYTELE